MNEIQIINENNKKILIPYVFHIYNNRVKYFMRKGVIIINQYYL